MTLDTSSSGLQHLLAEIGSGRTLPVETWNPPHCGDSEMCIARDGSWFHQGTRIDRPEMVRLFASVLRREPDGGFVLVTPFEKLSIAVEDAAFIAIALETEGTGRTRRIGFRLNTGDAVIAGPHNPVRVAATEKGSRPYVLVRAGLEALIARSAYYDLAALAIQEAADPPGLWSDGAFFALGDVE